MNRMTSAEARRAFLDYFVEMKHQEVPSSSLVPGNDPTLLFTNAGMVQFKDVFLGNDQRSYVRATTAQRCLRISGKHNDLEEVGPSPRHHTLFEMLGNFSFGDYFKKDAIRFAYEVLTRVYGLPLERLYFTVHDKDDEAYAIWRDDIGIPVERIYKLGDKTNFWQMADTGPCGYTSEIHWDWQPELGPEAVGAELLDSSGRVLEIWNLVFNQFNQNADGTRDLLPKPGIDTGMGFERIVSVLQNVRVNYETDLFVPIIRRVQELNGATDAERDANVIPYRVIADHARAVAFLIADGVTPGSKDRGYICRMLIRRAARFGTRIGFTQPFLADVADTVIAIMGDHYGELREKHEAIRKAITQEEIRFARTLARGMEELDSQLALLPAGGTLPGDRAFFLKSTLGLPFEVTRDIVTERGYQVDEQGFEKAQADHALDSGGGKEMGVIDLNTLYKQAQHDLQVAGTLPTAGVAYDPYRDTPTRAKLIGLIRDGQLVSSAAVGDRVEVILDATSFYVEAGGQVSDTGVLRSLDQTGAAGWAIDIEDMQRPIGGFIVHIGEVVAGTPHVGDTVNAEVDRVRRLSIMRNHSATHLLHAQLRAVLGGHVQQRGSLVAPDRLRFDFSHDAPVSTEEQARVSAAINAAILTDMPIITLEKDLASARAEGAMALFGEKYGDRVRTVRVCETVDQCEQPYSYELCGGIHVRSTAVIGSFVITNETSVGQGIRRIEAVTGAGAQQYVARQIQTLRTVSTTLNAPAEQLPARIEALREDAAAARREVERLRRQVAHFAFESLYNKRQAIGDVQVLVTEVEPTTVETLREMADWFRDKARSGVITLGMIADGKPFLLAAVTDDLTKRLQAGALIKTVAPIIGGGGGGRPNLAQAGGKDADQLGAALTQAREWIAAQLR